MAKKILVIEDNPQIQLMLSKALMKKDYEVEIAKTGIEGLVLFQSIENIDLILLDIMMPEMNGLEFLEKYKSLENTVPVIMLTALSMKDKIVSSLKSGAIDYIIKPLDFNLLYEKIENVINRRDGDHFSILSINFLGEILLPDKTLKVKISNISENSIQIESDFEIPLEGIFSFKSDFLVSEYSIHCPLLLRAFKCEKEGSFYRTKATFVALTELEYKKIRSFTTKGEINE